MKLKTFKEFIKDDTVDEMNLGRATSNIVTAAKGLAHVSFSSKNNKRYDNFHKWHVSRIKRTPGHNTPVSLLHGSADNYASRVPIHVPGDGNSPFIRALKDKGTKVVKGPTGEYHALNTSLRSYSRTN